MRLLLQSAGEKAWNMAMDEALLRVAHEPVLRLYGWDEPALSIGYFQPWSVVPAGCPFVRRYTGGGLVDHAADFTYTVVFPIGHRLLKLSTPESYSEIHRAVALTLQRIGLQPELAACCDEAEADACFQRAVKYDVTMAGRKVAGAAQRRTKEGMLQQGSVLLDDPAYYAALAQILPGALAEILGETLVGSELTKEEQALATSLRDERYATMEWNQRR